MTSERRIMEVQPLEPGGPDDTYTGKLVGWLDMNEELLACVRVPRNGLWWWQAPRDFDLGNGFDDHWLVVDGAPGWTMDRPWARPGVGAWVRARPAVEDGHSSFDLAPLPPRRTYMVWCRAPRPPAVRRSPFELPWWIRPGFPEDPDLEAWAKAAFAVTLDTRAAQGLPERYGWHLLGECSCGELGCGSMYVDVQTGSGPGWLEWREVHHGNGEGAVLGPWLEVPVGTVRVDVEVVER